MKIGIFHPLLSACGGAEWVAVNIISNLEKAGHKVVVLTNEEIDQKKIKDAFGITINAEEIIFPFQFFNDGNLHNVYTDGLRSLFLKTKCDLLIDTCSNALLPGADISYIHFPLPGRLTTCKSKLPSAFYNPYFVYEWRHARNNRKLVLVNSKYTLNTMKKLTGANPTLLYPPISKSLYINSNDVDKKENTVVSLSRLVQQKRVHLIPYIAKMTDKDIRFKIVGRTATASELRQIHESIERNGVSDRVEVITNASRNEIHQILQKSKVFLHLQICEHFGVAVAEAMASGCIPIVNDSGGPQEFVPQSLRFTQLSELPKKIEKAIFGWTPQESKKMVNLVQSFNTDEFSVKFNGALNSYINRYLR